MFFVNFEKSLKARSFGSGAIELGAGCAAMKTTPVGKLNKLPNPALKPTRLRRAAYLVR